MQIRQPGSVRPWNRAWVCGIVVLLSVCVLVPTQSLLAQGARTAVATSRAQEKTAPPGSTAPPPATRPADAPAVRTVTDETGRTVSVPVAPRRIISMAPSVTETLYALGAGERVIGVTTFCDYPPEAKEKPKIGGAVNPNFEQIAVLQPDLILATTEINRQVTVEAIERLGLPVYVTAPSSVEGMLQSTRRMAELLGMTEAGDALLESLRGRLEKLRTRLAEVQRKKVVFVVWPEPLITVGKDTFLADAIRLAGGEPAIDAPGDWPRIGLEELVRVQPEFLIFANAHAEQQREEIERLRERPGWRVLEAMQKNCVVILSDAINRPAPRMMDAIEALAQKLHPEAFEETTKPNAEGDWLRGCAR